MRRTTRQKIILLLLVAGILETALSIFFFLRIDEVVHTDLYRYGLQFSHEWADKYWLYARLTTGSLTIVIASMSISTILILNNVRTGRINSAKIGSCVLLLLGLVATGLGFFFFNKLDLVVNSDLYSYGLSFSYDWAETYWAYAKSMLSILGLAAFASSICLVLVSKPTCAIRPFFDAQLLGHKSRLTKLLTLALFSSGVTSLAFSISSNSSIPAFIGLGLVFWSAVLLYIQPEEHVKMILLEKTVLPSLANLDHMIEELGYRGKGIFLPPTNGDFESSKVYISVHEKTEWPSPAEILEKEGRLVIQQSKGMLLKPVGIELARLFEERLGMDLTGTGLSQLEQSLPRLLVEDLQIAKSVEMEVINPQVRLRLEDSVYRNICKETKKLSKICGSVGCPLCSAIACVLAKSTGREVTIETDQSSEDGQSINLEFRIVQ
jgi:hypothetical protein